MKDSSTKKKGIWKAILGVLLIIGSFGTIQDGFGTFILGFLIGLALLLWYLWPVLRNHLKAYQIREDQKRSTEEQERRNEEKKNAEWHMCKSCGARYQGLVCPYCRTHNSES